MFHERVNPKTFIKYRANKEMTGFRTKFGKLEEELFRLSTTPALGLLLDFGLDYARPRVLVRHLYDDFHPKTDLSLVWCTGKGPDKRAAYLLPAL